MNNFCYEKYLLDFIDKTLTSVPSSIIINLIVYKILKGIGDSFVF